MVSRKTYFVLILSIAFRRLNANEVFNKFVRPKNGYRVDQNYVDGVYQNVPTLMMCLALCTQKLSCLSTAYHSGDRTCELSYADTTFTYAQIVLLSQPGWMTMSKAYFTVFQAEGPLGHYSLPWEDAASTCLALDSMIASKADLMRSYTVGLTYCACGWLSDGSNGFIIADWDPQPCWSQVTDQITICPDFVVASNVWCLL